MGPLETGEERMVRWLKRIVLLVVALALVLAIAAWWALRASLPVVEGEQPHTNGNYYDSSAIMNGAIVAYCPEHL